MSTTTVLQMHGFMRGFRSPLVSSALGRRRVAREKKPLVPRLGNLPVIRRKCCCVIIGVLRKEDGVREDHDHDDNENVKKQLVL